MTITARTGEDEISNLVVENGISGYTISEPLHKLGWKASDTRELTFADCSVPEGEPARPAREGLRAVPRDPRRRADLGRSDGRGQQGAYDLAYAYAQERQQFGKPIAKFQAVAFKLADMAVEIEAGRQLVYRAAWLKDQGRPFALEAAMAKLYTGEPASRGQPRSADPRRLRVHGRVPPSHASTATRRSSRSARARTKSSDS